MDSSNENFNVSLSSMSIPDGMDINCLTPSFSCDGNPKVEPCAYRSGKLESLSQTQFGAKIGSNHYAKMKFFGSSKMKDNCFLSLPTEKSTDNMKTTSSLRESMTPSKNSDECDGNISASRLCFKATKRTSLPIKGHFSGSESSFSDTSSEFTRIPEPISYTGKNLHCRKRMCRPILNSQRRMNTSAVKSEVKFKVSLEKIADRTSSSNTGVCLRYSVSKSKWCYVAKDEVVDNDHEVLAYSDSYSNSVSTSCENSFIGSANELSPRNRGLLFSNTGNLLRYSISKSKWYDTTEDNAVESDRDISSNPSDLYYTKDNSSLVKTKENSMFTGERSSSSNRGLLFSNKGTLLSYSASKSKWYELAEVNDVNDTSPLSDSCAIGKVNSFESISDDEPSRNTCFCLRCSVSESKWYEEFDEAKEALNDQENLKKPKSDDIDLSPTASSKGFLFSNRGTLLRYSISRSKWYDTIEVNTMENDPQVIPSIGSDSYGTKENSSLIKTEESSRSADKVSSSNIKGLLFSNKGTLLSYSASKSEWYEAAEVDDVDDTSKNEPPSQSLKAISQEESSEKLYDDGPSKNTCYHLRYSVSNEVDVANDDINDQENNIMTSDPSVGVDLHVCKENSDKQKSDNYLSSIARNKGLLFTKTGTLLRYSVSESKWYETVNDVSNDYKSEGSDQLFDNPRKNSDYFAAEASSSDCDSSSIFFASKSEVYDDTEVNAVNIDAVNNDPEIDISDSLVSVDIKEPLSHIGPKGSCDDAGDFGNFNSNFIKKRSNNASGISHRGFLFSNRGTLLYYSASKSEWYDATEVNAVYKDPDIESSDLLLPLISHIDSKESMGAADDLSFNSQMGSNNAESNIYLPSNKGLLFSNTGSLLSYSVSKSEWYIATEVNAMDVDHEIELSDPLAADNEVDNKENFVMSKNYSVVKTSSDSIINYAKSDSDKSLLYLRGEVHDILSCSMGVIFSKTASHLCYSVSEFKWIDPTEVKAHKNVSSSMFKSVFYTAIGAIDKIESSDNLSSQCFVVKASSDNFFNCKGSHENGYLRGDVDDFLSRNVGIIFSKTGYRLCYSVSGFKWYDPTQCTAAESDHETCCGSPYPDTEDDKECTDDGSDSPLSDLRNDDFFTPPTSCINVTSNIDISPSSRPKWSQQLGMVTPLCVCDSSSDYNVDVTNSTSVSSNSAKSMHLSEDFFSVTSFLTSSEGTIDDRVCITDSKSKCISLNHENASTTLDFDEDKESGPSISNSDLIDDVFLTPPIADLSVITSEKSISFKSLCDSVDLVNPLDLSVSMSDIEESYVEDFEDYIENSTSAGTSDRSISFKSLCDEVYLEASLSISDADSSKLPSLSISLNDNVCDDRAGSLERSSICDVKSSSSFMSVQDVSLAISNIDSQLHGLPEVHPSNDDDSILFEKIGLKVSLCTLDLSLSISDIDSSNDDIVAQSTSSLLSNNNIVDDKSCSLNINAESKWIILYHESTNTANIRIILQLPDSDSEECAITSLPKYSCGAKCSNEDIHNNGACTLERPSIYDVKEFKSSISLGSLDASLTISDIDSLSDEFHSSNNDDELKKTSSSSKIFGIAGFNYLPLGSVTPSSALDVSLSISDIYSIPDEATTFHSFNDVKSISSETFDIAGFNLPSLTSSSILDVPLAISDIDAIPDEASPCYKLKKTVSSSEIVNFGIAGYNLPVTSLSEQDVSPISDEASTPSNVDDNSETFGVAGFNLSSGSVTPSSVLDASLAISNIDSLSDNGDDILKISSSKTFGIAGFNLASESITSSAVDVSLTISDDFDDSIENIGLKTSSFTLDISLSISDTNLPNSFPEGTVVEITRFLPSDRNIVDDKPCFLNVESKCIILCHESTNTANIRITLEPPDSDSEVGSSDNVCLAASLCTVDYSISTSDIDSISDTNICFLPSNDDRACVLNAESKCIILFHNCATITQPSNPYTTDDSVASISFLTSNEDIHDTGVCAYSPIHDAEWFELPGGSVTSSSALDVSLTTSSDIDCQPGDSSLYTLNFSASISDIGSFPDDMEITNDIVDDKPCSLNARSKSIILCNEGTNTANIRITFEPPDSKRGVSVYDYDVEEFELPSSTPTSSSTLDASLTINDIDSLPDNSFDATSSCPSNKLKSAITLSDEIDLSDSLPGSIVVETTSLLPSNKDTVDDTAYCLNKNNILCHENTSAANTGEPPDSESEKCANTSSPLSDKSFNVYDGRACAFVRSSVHEVEGSSSLATSLDVSPMTISDIDSLPDNSLVFNSFLSPIGDEGSDKHSLTTSLCTVDYSISTSDIDSIPDTDICFLPSNDDRACVLNAESKCIIPFHKCEQLPDSDTRNENLIIDADSQPPDDITSFLPSIGGEDRLDKTISMSALVHSPVDESKCIIQCHESTNTANIRIILQPPDFDDEVFSIHNDCIDSLANLQLKINHSKRVIIILCHESTNTANIRITLQPPDSDPKVEHKGLNPHISKDNFQSGSSCITLDPPNIVLNAVSFSTHALKSDYESPVTSTLDLCPAISQSGSTSEEVLGLATNSNSFCAGIVSCASDNKCKEIVLGKTQTDMVERSNFVHCTCSIRRSSSTSVLLSPLSNSMVSCTHQFKESLNRISVFNMMKEAKNDLTLTQDYSASQRNCVRMITDEWEKTIEGRKQWDEKKVLAELLLNFEDQICEAKEDNEILLYLLSKTRETEKELLKNAEYADQNNKDLLQELHDSYDINKELMQQNLNRDASIKDMVEKLKDTNDTNQKLLSLLEQNTLTKKETDLALETAMFTVKELDQKVEEHERMWEQEKEASAANKKLLLQQLESSKDFLAERMTDTNILCQEDNLDMTKLESNESLCLQLAYSYRAKNQLAEELACANRLDQQLKLFMTAQEGLTEQLAEERDKTKTLLAETTITNEDLCLQLEDSNRAKNQLAEELACAKGSNTELHQQLEISMTAQEGLTEQLAEEMDKTKTLLAETTITNKDLCLQLEDSNRAKNRLAEELACAKGSNTELHQQLEISITAQEGLTEQLADERDKTKTLLAETTITNEDLCLQLEDSYRAKNRLAEELAYANESNKEVHQQLEISMTAQEGLTEQLAEERDKTKTLLAETTITNEDLCLQLEDSNRAKNRLAEELVCAKGSNTELHQQLEIFMTAQEGLTEQLAEEMDKTKTLLAETTITNEDLCLQLEDFNRAKNRLAEELACAKGSNTELHQQLEISITAQEGLTEQLADERDKTKTLLAETTITNEDLCLQLEDSYRAKNRLAEELAYANESNEELHQQLEISMTAQEGLTEQLAEEMDKTKTLLAETTITNEDLCLQLEDSNRAKNRLAEELACANELHQRLEISMTAQEGLTEQLAEERDKTKTLLAESTTTNEDLCLQLEDSNRAENQLAEELAHANGSNKELRHELEASMTTQKELTEDLEKRKVKSDKASTLLAEFTKINQSLHHKLEDSDMAKRMLAEQFENGEQKFHQELENSNIAKNRLADLLRDAKRMLKESGVAKDELAEQLEVAIQANHNFCQELQDSDIAKNSLSKKLTYTSKELEESVIAKNEVNLQLLSANKKLDEYVIAKDRITEQLEDVTKVNLDLCQELKDSNIAKNQYTEANQRLQQELENAFTAKNELTLQIEKTEKMLRDSDIAMDELVERLAGANKEKLSLLQELDNAGVENDELAEELAHADRVIDDMNNELEDCWIIRGDLTTCNKKLKEELSKFADEKEENKKKLETADQLSQEMILKMENITSDSKELETELEVTRIKNDSLVQELNGIRLANEELKDELSEATEKIVARDHQFTIKVAAMNEKVDSTNQELLEVMKQAEEYSSNVEDMKAKLSTEKNELEAELKSKQTEEHNLYIEDMKKNWSIEKSKLEATNAELKNSMVREKEMASELKELQLKFVRQTDLLKFKSQNLEDLHSKSRAFNLKIEEKLKALTEEKMGEESLEVSELKSKLRRSENNTYLLERKAKEKEEDEQKLKKKLERAKQRIISIEEEAKRRLTKLKEDLKESEKRRRIVKKMLKEEEERAKSLELKVTESTNKLSTCKSEFTKEIDSLTEKLQWARDAQQKDRIIIEGARKSSAEIKFHKFSLESLQRQLDSSNNLVKFLKKDNENARSEEERLRKKVDDLTTKADGRLATKELHLKVVLDKEKSLKDRITQQDKELNELTRELGRKTVYDSSYLF